MELCRGLFKVFDIGKITESGTFRESTSILLSSISSAPLFACEIDEKSYEISRLEFKGYEQIILSQLDSRKCLASLANEANDE